MMNTDFERYDRQMKFHGFGPEGQEKLRRAKVLVVGAGGSISPERASGRLALQTPIR